MQRGLSQDSSVGEEPPKAPKAPKAPGGPPPGQQEGLAGPVPSQQEGWATRPTEAAVDVLSTVISYLTRAV